MSDLHASVLVTIRPHISQESMRALAAQIIDKLWPGNAGGVQVIFGRQMLQLAQRTAAYAAEHGMRVQYRVIRNGITYQVEPVGDPVKDKAPTA